MTLTSARIVYVLLALLVAFSLLAEIVFVPMTGQGVVRAFPETEPLFLPATTWSILVIGCGQAILVIVWKLVSLATQKRAFSAAAVPGVRAIIGISFRALALLVAAFVVANVLNYTPPLVMYGLIGLSLLCLMFALVMRIVLGLLPSAT